MPPTEGGDEWSGNSQHSIEPVNMREIQMEKHSPLYALPLKSLILIKVLKIHSSTQQGVIKLIKFIIIKSAY